MRPPHSRTTKFGRALTQLRENEGMTVTELAKRAGVSTSYVSQLETGNKRATDPIIRRISNALDINPIVLFTAAGMIPLPFADTVRPASSTVRLDEELSELEREELIKYLSFLRYEASLGPNPSRSNTEGSAGSP